MPPLLADFIYTRICQELQTILCKILDTTKFLTLPFAFFHNAHYITVQHIFSLESR